MGGRFSSGGKGRVGKDLWGGVTWHGKRVVPQKKKHENKPGGVGGVQGLFS